MPAQQQRTQPWKTFWSPAELPEKAGDARPEIVFEKGKIVIISDPGGFTPKTYTQLYKADAAPNTTKVNQDVLIEKYGSL
jgi:peroxiredoxin